MPWTAADAKDHVKGLTPTQARGWAAVANSALAKCEKTGGSNCDASAIKQANAVAQRIGESAALVDTLDDLLPLAEVGRVLSAENEAQVKAAIESLQALLAKLVKGETVEAGQQAEALREARDLLEAELSHDQTRSVLHDALRKAHGSQSYTYPHEVYPSHVIYSVSDQNGDRRKLYKRSYAINADTQQVTLGDPSEVQAVTNYVPVTESGEPIAEAAEIAGDVVPLVEKAVRKDGTAAVKIISAGWGSSGYYSPDVLKRDGPKVFKKGTHMYLDHPTAAEETDRPERSLKDLAAVLESDARWQDTGAAGPGLYAEAKVRTDVAPLIEELAPHIGVSIRALGKATQGEAEGKKGPIVESIAQGKSVDFVTLPGAGGRVLQLFESARARASSPSPKETTDMPELEEVQRQLNTTSTALEEARAESAKLAERLLLREARDFAAERLAAADVPQITRQRLLADLVKRPALKDGALDEAAFGTLIDEAVTAEQGYIAQLTGSGQVRGMGSAAPLSEAERKATADAESTLAEAFRAMGMSESQAKMAAAGR